MQVVDFFVASLNLLCPKGYYAFESCLAVYKRMHLACWVCKDNMCDGGSVCVCAGACIHQEFITMVVTGVLCDDGKAVCVWVQNICSSLKVGDQLTFFQLSCTYVVATDAMAYTICRQDCFLFVIPEQRKMTITRSPKLQNDTLFSLPCKQSMDKVWQESMLWCSFPSTVSKSWAPFLFDFLAHHV